MHRYDPSAYRGGTQLPFGGIPKDKGNSIEYRQDLDEPITNEKKQTKKIGRPRTCLLSQI